MSGHQRLAGLRQLPQKTDPDADRLLGIVVESVVPVGVIEVISILIRPVALAMRLYGNIYGGESVLTIMLELLPFGIAAIPFYFLELLVGVVQALVFTLLTAVFTLLIAQHGPEIAH